MPTAPVFPAPFIRRVPPTGMITVCRVPLLNSPGGQTVFMSPYLMGQGVPLHGPNIITTAHVPASNGVLMGPQPVVMAPSLHHVAHARLPITTPCSGPRHDPSIVSTLTSPSEKIRSPSCSNKRGPLIAGSPQVANEGNVVVLTETEDSVQNVLETSLNANGDSARDSSSQCGEEQEEEEENAEERVGSKEEDDGEGVNEKNIDHGDISFEIEDVSSASEDEEERESTPKDKTPTHPPPPTTTSHGGSNEGVGASPEATVLLPQQPYTVPNIFLPSSRVYQVVVPAGVHSNGAVESGQIMSVQQLFSQVKVEPYQQVKLVSVGAVNPVIGKEKNKQG